MKKYIIAAIISVFVSTAAFADPYAELKAGETFSQAESWVPNGGLDVGYDFGQVRTEVGYIRGYSSDLTFDALAGRVLFDIPVGRVIVSPGAGLAWVKTAGAESGADNTGLGYLAVIEGTLPLSERWAALVGYEFLAAGADINDGVNKDLKSHSVYAGVRYGF